MLTEVYRDHILTGWDCICVGCGEAFFLRLVPVYTGEANTTMVARPYPFISEALDLGRPKCSECFYGHILDTEGLTREAHTSIAIDCAERAFPA